MISYDDIKSGRAAVPATGDDHGLALAVIQIDGGTQSRATLDDHVVDDYAEAIKAGAAFPPIVVFYDGKKHWLADGFHRFHAYQKAGKAKVAADVRQGTLRDAILHSVGANETHGLRRTRDDKRRAVLTLLNDAEWGKWTDREIARRCAVSPQTVANVRADTVQNGQSDERTYVHPKTGKPTTMKTAGINASRKVSTEQPTAAAKVTTPDANTHGQTGTADTSGLAASVPASRKAEAKEVGQSGQEAAVELPVETGEAAPVGLPTISDAEREADAIEAEYDRASDGGRALFLARKNLMPKVERGSRTELSQETVAHMQRSDGGANIITHHTAINYSPSTAPTVEPEATPSPPPASGTPFPDPHSPRLTTGGLHPSSDDAGAKSGVPHAVGQGCVSQDIRNGKSEQQPASAPQARNEPGSESGTSVTQFLNPNCQKPEACKWARSQASCAACANAAAKARAAA